MTTVEQTDFDNVETCDPVLYGPPPGTWVIQETPSPALQLVGQLMSKKAAAEERLHSYETLSAALVQQIEKLKKMVDELGAACDSREAELRTLRQREKNFIAAMPSVLGAESRKPRRTLKVTLSDESNASSSTRASERNDSQETPTADDGLLGAIGEEHGTTPEPRPEEPHERMSKTAKRNARARAVRKGTEEPTQAQQSPGSSFALIPPGFGRRRTTREVAGDIIGTVVVGDKKPLVHVSLGESSLYHRSEPPQLVFTPVDTATDEQIQEILHRRNADSSRDAHARANRRTSEGERRVLLTVMGNSNRRVGIPVMLHPKHSNYVGQHEIHRDVSM